MSQINTNVNSLLAQRVLGQQNKALTQSLQRLSTGLRINSGKDDPAGLIASQKLDAQSVSIQSALNNAQRADQVANIAEGGLSEVSSLLTQVQGLVASTANDAGLSTDEKNANQLQIDTILQSIDRIASSTNFEGTNLLNGTYDFNVTGQSNKVQDLQINGAKIASGGSVTVKTIVTASAQHGAVFLSAGGTGLDLLSAGAHFTFELGGAKGSKQFTFSSGTTLSDVATGINNFKSVTGVSAVASGNYLEIKSTDFGSDQFVSFKLNDRGGQAGGLFYASANNENTYTTANQTAFTSLSGAASVRDLGADVAATVNGITARGVGKNLSVNSDALDLNFNLTTAGAQAAGATTAFTITGGGAKFNLGPSVDINNQVRLGLGNVATRNLGSTALGYLSDLGSGKANNIATGNLENAQLVVAKAIDQVSSLRGRIGAFQSNVVGSTINSLGVALENTNAANSSIKDADFAAETANLTRSQILVAAATQAVSLANNAPQSVLKLLQ